MKTIDDFEVADQRVLVRDDLNVPLDGGRGTADGADLLVVGSVGHGGLAGALLGSVGEYCAHNAACPVVIMRGKREG